MKKTLVLFVLIVMQLASANAQNNSPIIQKYNELKEAAQADFNNKNYIGSIEKYNTLIDFMEQNGMNSLVSSMKGFIGINWMYIATPLIKKGKYDEAIQDFQKAISYCHEGSKAYKQACSLMGTTLSYKASDIKSKNNDLKGSVSCSLEAEKYFSLAGKPERKVKEQVLRAEVMYDLGDVQGAKKLLTIVISQCRTASSTDTKIARTYTVTLGNALSTLGTIESKEDNFKDAISHLEDAYGILSQNDATNEASIVANVLSRIYTYSFKDSSKAQYWESKVTKSDGSDVGGSALAATTEKYITEKKLYIAAAKLTHNKQYAKSNETINSCIAQMESNTTNSKSELGDSYRLRANNYMFLKDYAKSVSDYKKAISVYCQAPDKDKANQCEAYYELAVCYYNWGNHQKEAIEASNKNVQMAEEYYGDGHSNTISAYSLRSNLAGFYKMPDLAVSDRQKVFEMIENNIEQNFTFMTEAERSAYWEKYRTETTQMLGFARNLKIKDGSFIDAIYDQQLLAKGLLLTTESALQRAIEGNASLSASYQKIRELRKTTMDDSKSKTEIDAATREADKLERTLSTDASGVTNFLKFLKVHVSDVKEKLKTGDVAIEFAECPKGKDSIMYSAVILKPEWEHAHHLMLCEKKDIKRDSSDLVNLIWQPILNVVGTGVKNIYFAPTGLLYQIPFESHLLADGTSIGKKYDLYRMSSTRLLATGNDTTEGKDVVLYGGLQYNTSISDLAADMKKYASDTSTTRGVNRSACVNEELIPLPATEKEVTAIAKVFNGTTHPTVMVNTLTGKQGTETSFKSLSGQHKRIAHIATHGFYNSTTTTDNALTNSGLYFAGADNFLLGETIPTSVDNGVLTAQEVADMDLSGMDVVTLSACQTGLGNVSADGVFGLQRGFKKAGAKSILMSLWKVDDAATCKLMTEFYTNWISKKMSKHDALEAAKKTVRETKGWEDPKYWAAFILLDGLD